MQAARTRADDAALRCVTYDEFAKRLVVRAEFVRMQ